MKEKLTKQQRCIAAAILGVSNAGSDHLFRGSRPDYGVDDIYHLLKRNDDVNSITFYFVRSLCETEEMVEMFQAESRSWYKRMKDETIESLSLVHRDYAHLFNAMRG